MRRVLVVYESEYGQSAKVAERAGELARSRGHDARVVHVDEADDDVTSEAWDAYVVVSPVYNTRHPANVTRFVRASIAALSSRPSAFLSVSASAASLREAVRSEADVIAWRYVRTFGWATPHVGAVGGALAYPRYGFFVGLAMRAIAWKNGLSTDVSRVHELTDWSAVDRVVLGALYAAESSERTTPASSERSIQG